VNLQRAIAIVPASRSLRNLRNLRRAHSHRCRKAMISARIAAVSMCPVA
jgi:hypothetical protein